MVSCKHFHIVQQKNVLEKHQKKTKTTESSLNVSDFYINVNVCCINVSEIYIKVTDIYKILFTKKNIFVCLLPKYRKPEQNIYYFMNLFVIRVYAVMNDATENKQKANNYITKKIKKRMNYKISVIILCCLLTTALSANAQSPEFVGSVISTGNDSAWYAKQERAWKKETEKNPNSEYAWRNLFKAKWYLNNWFNAEMNGNNSVESLISNMEKMIPNSFTYYLCKYRMNMGPTNEYGEKALKLLPDDAHSDDIDLLLGYSWCSGYADSKDEKTARFNHLLRKQYERSYYPEFALRYSYNQMEAMPENAIYIGNGDLDVLPKIMMQRCIGIHKGQIIVCKSFIWIKQYADNLCKSLGIEACPDIKEKYSSHDEIEYAEAAFIKYLMKKTGRPLYCGDTQMKGFEKNLYCEGLVFKYSEKTYDNIAATKNAVEKKYHLEYLTEPEFHIETYWKGSEKLQLNYVILLSHIVKEYQNEGNTERAKWLYNILLSSLENTYLPDSKKDIYVDYLKRNCK